MLKYIVLVAVLPAVIMAYPIISCIFQYFQYFFSQINIYEMKQVVMVYRLRMSFEFRIVHHRRVVFNVEP